MGRVSGSVQFCNKVKALGQKPAMCTRQTSGSQWGGWDSLDKRLSRQHFEHTKYYCKIPQIPPPGPLEAAVIPNQLKNWAEISLCLRAPGLQIQQSCKSNEHQLFHVGCLGFSPTQSWCLQVLRRYMTQLNQKIPPKKHSSP